MTVEDLLEVVAIASKLAKEDRLISSSASCAIQRARPSSSAKSSSSVSSVMTGCGSRPGPDLWAIDEDVLAVVLALVDSPKPSPGVLCDTEAGFDGLANSVGVVAGAAKLQDEVAKYAGSRLLRSEYDFGVSLLEARGDS